MHAEPLHFQLMQEIAESVIGKFLYNISEVGNNVADIYSKGFKCGVGQAQYFIINICQRCWI